MQSEIVNETGAAGIGRRATGPVLTGGSPIASGSARRCGANGGGRSPARLDAVEPTPYRTIADAVKERHNDLVSLAGDCDEEFLAAASKLPGWSRLTILCHLRYGGEASARMTRDILNGAPTAFYPEGPEQRPATLVPRAGESARDVVASLAESATILDRLWEAVDDSEWESPLIEPHGNTDLGAITLGHVAVLRLTEVEVHGTDLGIAASDWSEVFVRAAFPMRVHWQADRRPHPEIADHSIGGTWVLAPDDGEAYSITASPDGVEVRMGDTVGTEAARLHGTRRSLLAFLLGRTPIETLDVSGNSDLAPRFHQAFPPP